MDASNKFYAYGQGRVYQDVLAELKQKTLELRTKYTDAPIVWLLHFAPFDCGSHQFELPGWDAMLVAAVALKVTATLCGQNKPAESASASRTRSDSHSNGER